MDMTRRILWSGACTLYGLLILMFNSSDFVVNAQEATAKSSEVREQWLKRYIRSQRKAWFQDRELPVKLVITAVEGQREDADDSDGQFGILGRWTYYGFKVALDWQTASFRCHSLGSSGGGYTKIPEGERARLDELLAKLPEESSHFPPVNRRLAVQFVAGDQLQARIYDRANLPDEILEILRLVSTTIRPWVLMIEPTSVINAHSSEHWGAFALSQDGLTLISTTKGQSFKFWDATTHELLREVPAPDCSSELTFSPDGSHAVVRCCSLERHVLDTRTWRTIIVLRGGLRGPEFNLLATPQFTRDGRFVLFQSSETGVQVYDTTNWKEHKRLPGAPDGVRAYFPAPKGRVAIVHSRKESMSFWDAVSEREFAKLDEKARIQAVAFSPDESQVAVATVHAGPGDYLTAYRIRTWEVRTGRLLHELRPFERSDCNRVDGLLWTPDGCYLMAAASTDSWGGSYQSIAVWNAKTGRHRANFNDFSSLVTGLALLPNGQELVAGSRDGTIKFWDLKSALKKIREFELSLGEVN